MADNQGSGQPNKENLKKWQFVAACLIVVLVSIALLTYWYRVLPWATFVAIAGVLALALALMNKHLRWRSQKLWLGLLIFAVILVLASLAYQSNAARRESQAIELATPQFSGMTVVIAYPKTLRLDPANVIGQPLTIYLATPTPTTSTSGIVTATPTMSPPSTPGPTLTPSATATSTAITYTVRLSSADQHLVFNDEKGAPIGVSDLQVTAGQTVEDRAVTFLHWLNPTASENSPNEVNINTALVDHLGQPHPITVFTVAVEDIYTAWWRNFWGLLFGPTTPLLVLAATIIGFAWEEYKNAKNEREKQLAHIQALDKMLVNDPEQAVLAFEKIWLSKDEHLKQRLASMWDGRWERAFTHSARASLTKKDYDHTGSLVDVVLEFRKDDHQASSIKMLAAVLTRGWKDWLGLEEGVTEGHDSSKAFRADGQARCDAKAAVNAIFDLTLTYGDALQLQPTTVALLGQALGEQMDSRITEQVVQALWEISQEQPACRLMLRQSTISDALQKTAADASRNKRTIRQAGDLARLGEDSAYTEDPPAVSTWLKHENIRLNFNPFGPERAEDDKRFLDRCVEPPQWDRIKSPSHTLITGKLGSGKTACLLFLEQQCESRKITAFPVRIGSLDRLLTESSAALILAEIAHHTCRSLLDYLASHPEAFGNHTTYEQRRALARLFIAHTNRLGDPAEYLQNKGCKPEAAEQITRSLEQAGRGTRTPSSRNLSDMIGILDEARLSDFQNYYVLVEIDDESWQRYAVTEFEGFLRFAKYLTPISIYLKVCMPVMPDDLLPDVEFERVVLQWDAAKLKGLIDERFKAVGSMQTVCKQPEVSDPQERLIKAAKNLPRQVVHYGNELIRHRAGRADLAGDQRLTNDDFTAVLPED